MFWKYFIIYILVGFIFFILDYVDTKRKHLFFSWLDYIISGFFSCIFWPIIIIMRIIIWKI